MLLCCSPLFFCSGLANMAQTKTEDPLTDTDIPEDFSVLGWAGNSPHCDGPTRILLIAHDCVEPFAPATSRATAI